MNLSRELRDRLKKARNSMDERKIDSLLISNPKNVLYLTGRESGRLLLSKKQAFLWVRDLYLGVYKDLYKSSGYPIEVLPYEKDAIAKKARRLNLKSVGIEHSNLAQSRKLRSAFKSKVKPTGIIENQRAVKTGYEIEMLKKSASIAVKGMEKAFKVVTEGAREVDAAAEIEKEIRRQGSETTPFHDGMLLSSGSRSADIHAHPTRNRIKGLVIADLGARYNYYYSDMTRTIAIGKTSKKEKELLGFVENLKDNTIDQIKPGVKASEVHDWIEDELKKKGFKFYHAAGHGIGLEVHEKPGLGGDSEDTLEEDMAFTIEPGIYIPNKYGIRFEDTVILTKKGCKTITKN
jgi:Xaa-Pro aminopeptidase